MARAGLKREDHFESMERQAESARFGMWIFLASEVLLFGSLFALYGAYRASWHHAFSEGVRENDAILGTLNTLLLLFSSFLIALGVHRLNRNRPKSALWLTLGTVCVGGAFLVIKFHEYGVHFSHGIFPGGKGAYFAAAPLGTSIFFTLYFAMTGLHALHMFVGIAVMLWCARRIYAGRIGPHAFEVGALYWHLVDCIWIFLWPLFYLLRG